MTSEQDKLLACWCRKSIDVTAKLILYAACAIDTLAVGLLAILAFVWTYENFYSPTVSLFTGFASLVLLIIAFVPWYVWLGIIGVGGSVTAILVYAYAWCVAREFNKEDWDCGDNISNLDWYTKIMLVILLVPILIELSIKRDDIKAKTIYMLMFPSAYLHYRKRIKGEKQ